MYEVRPEIRVMTPVKNRKIRIFKRNLQVMRQNILFLRR